ncbi:MAG: DUF1570 domain-containing protein [Phycisphaerales bacterium JB050]
MAHRPALSATLILFALGGIASEAPVWGETSLASASISLEETFARAQVALQEGRAEEADRLLRAVLRTDPDQERAATMLRALYINYGLKLPVDEGDLSLVRDQLGSRWYEFGRYESQNFVVLSDASRDWTNRRLALLERTHFQFTRTMKLMGLQAIPAEEKLLCILFAEHADYADFAQRTDKVQAPWVAGYYASGSNRIVMYDDATGPTFARANQQIAELEKQADEARTQARGVDRSQAARAEDYAKRVREHAEREGERIRSLIRAASDAKAVHEATHLIAFNCGLQSRSRRYPFWLTEGLATNFETEDATGAFGPDRPIAAREKDFKVRMEAGELVPVSELVTLSDIEHYESEQAGAVYAQSYALFRYLFRTRREALGQLFRDIQSEPAGQISDARMLELFESRIGPADLVEREWLRFEQR